jgi:tetratricopeptide (TPR) repeat protein
MKENCVDSIRAARLEYSHRMNNFVRIILLALALSHATFAQTAREQAILQIQERLQTSDTTGARAALTQARKRYPQDAGLDNLLGILEAQAGHYAAAEKAFTLALTRQPRFTGAALNLGRLYLENSTRDAQATTKALNVYQRVLRWQPDHPEANYQSALLLVAQNQAQRALIHLGRLPENLQRNANVIALVCAAQAALQAKEPATQAAQQLLTHAEFTAPDLETSLPLLEKHRPDLAWQLLLHLAERGQATSAFLHRLGLLQEQQGQFAEAQATLASVTDKRDVALLLDRARIAYRLQEWKNALALLGEARDLEPKQAQIHYLFGLTCIRMELVAEAHLAFGKAVALAPGHAEYNYAMGAASAYRRDPAEALPYLKKYRQLKPDDAQGRLMLGVTLFKNGDLETARVELQAATTFPPTAPSAHYFLGRIARQMNDLTGAIAALQQALRLDAKLTDAWAELGQVYLQQRNYVEAEKALQQALSLDADNYQANFQLLTLYARTQDARQAEQTARFEQVKQKRAEREELFLRAIEVRPYREP